MRIDIMPKDTNFAFNLSHIRAPAKEKECWIKKVPNNVLADIMVYLPAKEVLSMNLVSK